MTLISCVCRLFQFFILVVPVSPVRVVWDLLYLVVTIWLVLLHLSIEVIVVIILIIILPLVSLLYSLGSPDLLHPGIDLILFLLLRSCVLELVS